MSDPARNPDLKCTRRRPACAHRRAEHGPKACFGVTMVYGEARECPCPGMMEPPDPPRFVRVGESVEE